tara:strand:- start:565 stop:981 length:417 start_codon:yes stop_codon:yes gene_type:complete
MNDNYKLDIAYVAGIFDGEGSLTYKKYKERRKKGNKVNYYDCWRIAMEISMTDKNTIELIHETLMCGTVRPKKVPKGMKPQWRWRCTFRDCLYVCKKLWPFAIVKLHKIEQVIDHYEPDIQELGDNVVDINLERDKRR